MAVYLIHFDERLYHAGHYLGYSSNLTERIRAHRQSRGARLMEVVNGLGINWRVVRVWPDGDYELERALKARHNGPQLCPLCNPGVSIGVGEEVAGYAVVPELVEVDASAFGVWLARWADRVVGWSDEPLDCPLGRWLRDVYGGQWQVNALFYRWRERDWMPWGEWQALPPWAVFFLDALALRFGNVGVSGREVLEVLEGSLLDLAYWQAYGEV